MFRKLVICGLCTPRVKLQPNLAPPQSRHVRRPLTASPARGAAAAADARACRREHDHAVGQHLLTADKAGGTAREPVLMEQAAARCRGRPRDSNHTAAGDGAAREPLRGDGRRSQAASTAWYGFPARSFVARHYTSRVHRAGDGSVVQGLQQQPGCAQKHARLTSPGA